MAADSGMLKSWYDDYTKQQNPTAQQPATQPEQQPGQPAQPDFQPTAQLGGMLGAGWRSAAQPYAKQNQAWQQEPDTTVAGQLNKLTAAGSPLIDQATTAAKQAAASRGLLNSTMGVTAGLDAAYRAALPIAQQDADTARAAAQQMRDIQNQRYMQSAGFEQQSKLQESDFAQQSRTQAADLASRYDLAKMDVASRERLQAADALNQQKLQSANAELQRGLQASDAEVKQSMQVYDAALKKQMQGLDNESRLQLATLDADNRLALAGIEAKYKEKLQANQSMAASYQSMVDGMTRIMVSPDMDAGAKQAAIGNLTTLYNNTLQMQSDITGLELGRLLAPDEIGGVANGATPSPQVPAPGQQVGIPGSEQSPYIYENPGGA